uniref:Uncharacterized protein n=1 Tax=Rhodosorus marinus TaxID=101924 RepID=A0A7S0G450_9RHOD|mmetsp:Transcript_21898/g.31743  ORF Transcript_21898/g.31743 Transcript_21898/m.31743 type:complete len:311 (+) Transcript_21898:203-1135(+)
MSVRMKANNKESAQILGLRKEVKEKGLAVGKLKEKMRNLKELALAEDTTAKAFEAFRAGPEAFEKEIKREIVPDIATGKISDAKSSLYTEKQLQAMENNRVLGNLSKENGASEQINGVDVATVEEIEVGEIEIEIEEDGEVAAEIITDVVEESHARSAKASATAETSQVVQDPANPPRTILVDEAEKGNVSSLLAKFKDMEMKSEEESKLAKSEERRRAEARKAMQLAADTRERELKLSQFAEMRKDREARIARITETKVDSDFYEKWPYGEPHKQDLLVRYLSELSEHLDKEKTTLEVQISELESVIAY